MEVYVGTGEDIQLRAYAGGGRVNAVGDVTASLYDYTGELVRAGVAEVVLPVDSGESHEYYSFPLTIAETAQPAAYTVKWEYQPAAGVDAVRNDLVEVIAPYVWPDQAREEFPALANRTWLQLKHIERVVRYTINAYCGQSFGYEPARTYLVQGSGSRSLWLPKRLVRLDTVTYGTSPISPALGLTHNNRVLSFPGYSGAYRDIKADIGLGYGPYTYFLAGHNYAVTGDWGWEHIPNEVQQAASILLGRFSEPEQSWRRYNVESISAADWSMDFERTSLETTGDVDADMALSKYKVAGFGVV